MMTEYEEEQLKIAYNLLEAQKDDMEFFKKLAIEQNQRSVDDMNKRSAVHTINANICNIVNIVQLVLLVGVFVKYVV